MSALFVTARGTAAEVRSGSRSARSVVEASLHLIGDDETVSAFTVVLDESALATADALDSARDHGEPLGPLAGVPISVKDHVWVRGAPATNGSRALASFVPDADCVCVERLRAAGAVIVGKTNNPEFCYRGITDNELWGLTRNPRDPSRTPGGSSGGAAASVAAGMVPLAVGTDGGGSIRIPAAFCGVAGIKPTFGRVPKLPGFRGWPTLSVTGPLASTVGDLALALAVMGGPAAEDDLTYPGPPIPEDLAAALQFPGPRATPAELGAVSPGISGLRAASPELGAAFAGVSGLRIAASVDLGLADVDADVRHAFEAALARLPFAVTREHPVPYDVSALWDAIALAEGWASEGPLLEATPELIGADARALVEAGAAITAREYLDAQHLRTAMTHDWSRFFERFDVLLTPTMPVTAFPVGQLGPSSLAGRPVPESFDAWCALALPANLTGFPALSIPCGAGADGLPVGLQIIGPRWSEPLLLRVGAAIERLLA